ncbi:MAG: 3-deoxy-D-manno-octulosonic acid transferase [Planctomycetaceae bacterium]|jgi:3-deoxy-D-manno-octulosonic-acid transferase|nr:3-deoxy-D-manno-octulosonic acid transferase [Planctomycetaceae bacterium]
MFKRWLFNFIYLIALTVFSPMLLYRSVKHGKYRNGFRQKYLGRIPRRRNVLKRYKKNDTAETKIVWFHAVSVGEVNLLRPLLKLIKETKPDWNCVVSTTSQTGMELAEKIFGKDYTVFYCPLDFSWAVSKAVQRLQPTMLVLAEQELWSNLIDAVKQSGAKVAVVNGRFSEGGYKNYLRIRPFIAPMLRQLDTVAVQSETYAGWFRQLGASADAIQITGSMKFDGARSDRNNPDTQRFRQLAGITDSDVVFFAGSTQAPEEQYAVECYENLKNEFPQLRLILVPRHPERFEDVAKMLDGKGVLWQRRSAFNERETLDSAPAAVLPDSTETSGNCSNKEVVPRILLVDTVGELGAWWGTAHIAFVGGSMGSRGGQNMLEPSAYGAAVSFGPNTKNFRGIVDLLLRNDAAKTVNDQVEMQIFVRRCLEEPAFAQQL